MVAAEFPQVNLIRNTTNKGFSAANNQAILLSKGRYILLLNPDTLVEKETFIGSLRFMDSHQDARALGVKMINGDGEFLPESKRSIPSVSQHSSNHLAFHIYCLSLRFSTNITLLRLV